MSGDIYNLRRNGKRCGFPEIRPPKQCSRRVVWNDPEVLARARASGESPASIALRMNGIREAFDSPHAQRQFESWVMNQNRARASRGLPDMTDGEVEAAAAALLAANLSR
jgi:hypothetical protein